MRRLLLALFLLVIACIPLQAQDSAWVTVQVRNLGFRELVVYVTTPAPYRLGSVVALGEANLRVRRSLVEEKRVGFILYPMGGPAEEVPSVQIPPGINRIRLRADPPGRSSAYYTYH